MRLRIVSSKTVRVLELEDVSQVVVFTDEGDPCSVSVETPDRAVITGHAAEQDFPSLLKRTGVRAETPVEVLRSR